MKSEYPLSQQEFDTIYSKVPRLTVEVLLYDKNKGVYLTLRDIEPCKDRWHLPGGTVYFGEPVMDTVKRIAKREVGINVTKAELTGYIEYPSHYQNKLDCPIGLVFKINNYNGTPKPATDAKEGQWLISVPPNMHGDQDNWLIKNNYLKT